MNKRLNRKYIIAEVEFLRQGFKSALNNAIENKDKIAEISMNAYHRNADRLVGELGGACIRDDNKNKKK